MVRNNKGGKNGKKVARKHANAETMDQEIKFVRMPEDPSEFFACCKKMLGNATCSIVDFNGNEYICVIRKKFKGRGRRQNTITRGTIMLVGKRGFETQGTSTKPKCDVLEVYNEKEMQFLRKECNDLQWRVFDQYGDAVKETAVQEQDGDIEFVNTQPDYEAMMEELSYSDDSDDIDDIDEDEDEDETDSI